MFIPWAMPTQDGNAAGCAHRDHYLVAGHLPLGEVSCNQAISTERPFDLQCTALSWRAPGRSNIPGKAWLRSSSRRRGATAPRQLPTRRRSSSSCFAASTYDLLGPVFYGLQELAGSALRRIRLRRACAHDLSNRV